MKRFILISGLLLTSVAVNSCQKCRVKDDANCMCTMEYAPVCGCNDKTYGNACMAECAVVEYKPGECGK